MQKKALSGTRACFRAARVSKRSSSFFRNLPETEDRHRLALPVLPGRTGRGNRRYVGRLCLVADSG